MQGFTCTLCVVWKLLSLQKLSCLPLSCLKPEGPETPGLATGYGWTPGARAKALALRAALKLEKGFSFSPRNRLKPSGVPPNRTASPSHFELTCIWVEKNSFFNLKLAKCWPANMSEIIFSCTNQNINFFEKF